jgi:hypothetical protein
MRSEDCGRRGYIATRRCHHVFNPYDERNFKAKWGPLMVMQTPWWSDWWRNYENVEDAVACSDTC